jgi:predicted Zn-dependent protease
MSESIARLETLQAKDPENALLRFSLGNAYLGAARYADAAVQFAEAVRLDPNYAAAWKLLGKALTETGDTAGAADAYRRGIATAEASGHIQAAKEMKVFLKRLGEKP